LGGGGGQPKQEWDFCCSLSGWTSALVMENYTLGKETCRGLGHKAAKKIPEPRPYGGQEQLSGSVEGLCGVGVASLASVGAVRENTGTPDFLKTKNRASPLDWGPQPGGSESRQKLKQGRRPRKEGKDADLRKSPTWGSERGGWEIATLLGYPHVTNPSQKGCSSSPQKSKIRRSHWEKQRKDTITYSVRARPGQKPKKDIVGVSNWKKDQGLHEKRAQARQGPKVKKSKSGGAWVIERKMSTMCASYL